MVKVPPARSAISRRPARARSATPASSWEMVCRGFWSAPLITGTTSPRSRATATPRLISCQTAISRPRPFAHQAAVEQGVAGQDAGDEEHQQVGVGGGAVAVDLRRRDEVPSQVDQGGGVRLHGQGQLRRPLQALPHAVGDHPPDAVQGHRLPPGQAGVRGLGLGAGRCRRGGCGGALGGAEHVPLDDPPLRARSPSGAAGRARAPGPGAGPGARRARSRSRPGRRGRGAPRSRSRYGRRGGAHVRLHDPPARAAPLHRPQVDPQLGGDPAGDGRGPHLGPPTRRGRRAGGCRRGRRGAGAADPGGRRRARPGLALPARGRRAGRGRGLRSAAGPR